MSLNHFLSVIRARFWLLVAVFAAIVGLTVGASLMMSKKYTASAIVLIDVKSPDPVVGGMLPAHLLNSYIATQVELLSSEKVAVKVVEKLNLHADPKHYLRFNEQANGEGSIKEFIAAGLRKSVSVKPARDSNMLEISVTSTDREAVAPLANAFVRAYIDTTVAIRVSPARDSRTFFEDQLKLRRDVLDAAQTRLSEFQRTKGLYSNDERFDIENARLMELSQQMTQLQAAAAESARRRQSARAALTQAAGSDAPEVLQNPLIQTLKAELVKAEARLRERSAVLGASHPEIQRLQAEADSIRNRLDRETKLLTTGLDRSADVTRLRESDVRKSLDLQRKKVLELKQARDQSQALERDVDSARKGYESVLAKLDSTSLESASTQTNIVPIEWAATPSKPSSPNLLLNSMVAVVLGSLLGVVTVLGLEAANARVRLPEDLARVAEAPFLGELGRVPPRVIAHGSGGRDSDYPDRLAMPTEFFDDRLDETIIDPPTVLVEPVRSEAISNDTGEATAEALLSAGVINRADVEVIESLASEKGLRFGEAAVSSGLVQIDQIRAAVASRATVAFLDPNASPVAKEVVAAFDADHPFVDDLRQLRAQIISRWLRIRAGERKSFAIVSHGPGDGKSFTAANLAVCFAQMGYRTLLIDADMREGRQHELFAVDNSEGLSSLLAGRCRVVDALRKVPGIDTLQIIPAGPNVASPSDLLARDTFTRMLKVFSKSVDVILVDTPSVRRKADTALITAAARGYIVVARQHRSLVNGVRTLIKALKPARAKLIGTVLVRA